MLAGIERIKRGLGAVPICEEPLLDGLSDLRRVAAGAIKKGTASLGIALACGKEQLLDRLRRTNHGYHSADENE
ncbi:MAG: hypothetical protein NVSMB62_07540 [Acidobacteriaceae bacterium]